MRIAQVAPLCEAVPPKAYGGIERIVAYLTDELIRQGHEVTLFASADSKSSARLINHSTEALRHKGDVQDSLAHNVVQLQDVVTHADEFDLLHFHTGYLHFPVTALMKKTVLTTLHTRLDIPDLVYVYHKFKQQPLVSVSDAQREAMPVDVNWLKTVYHGIPENQYHLGDGAGDYAVFVGKISPEKRPDRAISIAKEAGMKIKIAAKIDHADRSYYETMIAQLIKQPHVEFVGEVGEEQKQSLIGNARAFLFPIDSPEPSSLSVIEALACGTPVIAYNHGAVSELVSHGESGFVVDHFHEAVDALKNIDVISRKDVRAFFERNFTARVMAERYMRIYETLLPQKKTSYELMGV